MTSEILQLFTQALEMLISWSSFDCILNSRTCNFIHRTIMMKPMKTTLEHVLLKLSTPWVRNGSVQFTALWCLQGLSILSARVGLVFSNGCTQWVCALGPPQALFTARRKRGTSQRRWPPAPCRTPPARSRPPARWCGRYCRARAGGQPRC